MDKSVGRHFKEYRERKGITQEELGAQVGLSSNFISAVERGLKFPRYENFIKILNILEISADDILCDVIDYPAGTKASILSEQIMKLPVSEQNRILETIEFLVEQANRNLK